MKKEIQKNTEILNQCKQFYQKLYNSQNTSKMTQKHLLEHIQPKISDLQNRKLTKQIEISEIQQAIQSMENRKSPGIDGIPKEFYKENFHLLKKNLQETFNKIMFQTKITPTTWK